MSLVIRRILIKRTSEQREEDGEHIVTIIAKLDE